ncbi:sensor histidine kinase [Actinocatenispora sera]|uniref:histidine kinase n=1 Tax=Actinocatenispora sera TaxID=390989 RepID=A0A810L2M5_9ACTN|nr:histidine kinase [Actinocatenispora sera]BCJ28418.1 ATPase [Actinocatenispora sera]
MRYLPRPARAVAALLVGALTVPFDALVLAAAGLAVLVTLGRPAPRRVVGAALRRLTAAELSRATRWPATRPDPPHVARGVGYLLVRLGLGLLGGAVLTLFGAGLVAGVRLVAGWLTGRPLDGITPSWPIVGYLAAAGLVLAFLAVQGMIAVAALDLRWANWAVRPGRAALEHRIDELSVSRAAVVAAVDGERRRIERDLHDGVQQRLVALGMLLGRARRATDPQRSTDLLRAAHEESRRALVELREVAWRVYPSALDSAGLPAALESVAERAGLPVRLDHRLRARPPAGVEAACYFVVCEAITNAAKHATARAATVRLTEAAGVIRIEVHDDGCGGADPAGPGLSGLARRLAAVDGRLSVFSPPGGPTLVTAEIPACAAEPSCG